MATVTKTFTESYSGSTWTVTVTGTDQTVSGNFNLNIPTVTAKYVYAAKNYAGASVAFSTNTSSSFAYNLPTDGWSDIAWASNATKTITNTSSSRSVTLSTLFNASNKTSKTANITATCGVDEIYLRSYRYSGGAVEYGHDYNNSSSVSLGTISTITLNAPPTVTLGTPTYAAPQYAGLGAYSLPVTEAKALYGGDVTSITLAIGADTDTKTYSTSTVSSQTFTIIPSQPGTFTPTLTVTDSRGQTKTESLPQITVNSYTAPTLNFNLSRCTNVGLIDAEGEYGLVSANISYIDALAELTQPTVTAVDENGTSVAVSATWYETWDAVNGVDDAVNWTNYQPASPVTLYAIVSVTGDVFSPNESYFISITPTDNMGGVAQTVTQSLSTGFFTIDFQAGGKEIAFGAPANDNLASYPDGLFKCQMDARFNGNTDFNSDVQFTDNASTLRLLFDFIHPVGSYYETSDTAFDPNVTWGGTWVLETEGQVHVSAGANYVVNGAPTDTNDGGAETVTLDVTQMPSHSHGLQMRSNNGTGSVYGVDTPSSPFKYTWAAGRIENTGGGNAHENMPPYIIVNRWHRTA